MSIRPPQPRKTEPRDERAEADARRRAETGASPDSDARLAPVATGAHTAESIQKKGCGCGGADEDSTRDMPL